jgi:murein DD-endopeptidase MepM/ murein hydrolase activator NlpD
LRCEIKPLRMKQIFLVVLLFIGFSLQLSSKGQSDRHTVKKGETLYSLSKKYGVTLSELAKANSISTRTEIKIGQRLLIPGLKGKKDAPKAYKPVSVPSTPDTPWREEDIRPRTTLVTTQSARPIAVEKPKAVIVPAKPAVIPADLKTISSNPAEYPDIFNQYPAQGYKIKRNRGTANYLADGTSGNQNLAFYNDAEIGSLIRVTNLMNQKTIFVKVVGKVPPADLANEIIVKLSDKAAQDLEAKDSKFLVEIASYSGN